MINLPEKDLKYIIEIISQYPEVDKAVVFGSRAMNSNRKSSDIDIALFGNNIRNTVLTISGKLNDEGPLPYMVDVVDFNTLDNEKLIDHINRVGKEIPL